MTAPIVQTLLIVVGPLFCIWLVKQFKIEKWLSPVVLAYALGILVANLHLFPILPKINTTFSEITVVFAIPMLLYATDIKAWLRYAPKTLISFALCVVSGLVASTVAAFFFHSGNIPNWMVSGMLVGVYTGGTPNMQAIGLALGAGEEAYVLLNAADIFCGGLYLLFLTSVAHRLFGYLLPEFEGDKGLDTNEEEFSSTQITLTGLLQSFGLTLLVIAGAVGGTYLITGAMKSSSLIILLLTTGSIVASFSPRVRRINGAFEIGEYLLLMFCVAVGMLSDFQDVWENGSEVVRYTGVVMLSTASLHVLLSMLFKIDRDTTLITSTAAIYGPVFIGQVAAAIGNRTLVFSGMATGLIGFAIGNYLGIGMAYFLKWLLVV